MGNITYAVCHDCKIKRDLDKFYIKEHKVTDTDSANLVSGKIYYNRKRCYQAALLISFMKSHSGHSCGLTEDSTGWCMNYADDFNYWQLANQD